MSLFRTLLASVGILLAASPCFADEHPNNWPQWRGPEMTGVAPAGTRSSRRVLAKYGMNRNGGASPAKTPTRQELPLALA